MLRQHREYTAKDVLLRIDGQCFGNLCVRINETFNEINCVRIVAIDLKTSTIQLIFAHSLDLAHATGFSSSKKKPHTINLFKSSLNILIILKADQLDI